jgi:AraC-like DNA-binding protein
MHYLNYEERKKHGTDAFPLEYYAVDEMHPRYTMPFHWHNEAELLYIVKGEFTVILDRKELHLKQGEVCYIPGGTMHGGEGINCVYECIDFDVNQFMRQLPPVRRYMSILESQTHQIQNRFDQDQPEILACVTRMFSAARTREAGWEMLMLAGLYDFYGTVLQKDYRVPVQKEKSDRANVLQINAAIECITHHYKEKITLEDLARAATLSPKYFCKYFHVVTGKTPIAYLNYYRVERACFLLEQRGSSVTEAALECGFNDVSYFIRCFKKQKGITPYQYIKKTENRNN